MTKTPNVVSSAEVAPLRQTLESPAVLRELAKVLPRSLSPAKLARQALTLAQRTPGLLACTPKSILMGVMSAAELGLELTGPLGHCWLIPRKVKGVWTAVFQVGWKGLVALAMRSGKVGEITVREVREGDEFEVELGTAHRIHHKMCPHKDAGQGTHYYAVAFYKPVPEAGYDFEVLSREQVDEHRRRYCQDSPAWQTAYPSMAKKTVVAALCRRMSLCPDAQIATAVDDGYGFHEEPQAQGGGRRGQELLEHLDHTLAQSGGEGAQEAVEGAEAQGGES